MLTPSLDSIHQDFKDEIGFSIDKVLFIRYLNFILRDLVITKPAERITDVYFNEEFRKYPLEADFRSPISLRDISLRDNQGLFHRFSPAIMSQSKYGQGYTIQNNGKAQFLEIVHRRSTGTFSVLTNCDSLTADGTWASVSNVSNIATDSIVKAQGDASISFDVGAATGEISFTRTKVIDISEMTRHMGVGFNMLLPEAPTQITIKWGNDASNYYSRTVTAQASGETFDTSDFNEIRALKSDASETGTVDDENVDYFTVTLTFSSAPTATGFLIDNIIFFKPQILKFEYYSKYLAQDSNGIIAKVSESATSTDQPLIFDDYIPTVINGLAWRYFKTRKPELARQYMQDYIMMVAQSGALVGGKRYLELRYPNREQRIRSNIRLPAL